MMVRRAFISISKLELQSKLKKKNIRPKYHPQIYERIKVVIEDSLDGLVEQAIEQHRIFEGQETLESKKLWKRNQMKR